MAESSSFYVSCFIGTQETDSSGRDDETLWPIQEAHISVQSNPQETDSAAQVKIGSLCEEKADAETQTDAALDVAGIETATAELHAETQTDATEPDDAQTDADDHDVGIQTDPIDPGLETPMDAAETKAMDSEVSPDIYIQTSDLFLQPEVHKDEDVPAAVKARATSCVQTEPRIRTTQTSFKTELVLPSKPQILRYQHPEVAATERFRESVFLPLSSTKDTSQPITIEIDFKHVQPRTASEIIQSTSVSKQDKCPECMFECEEVTLRRGQILLLESATTSGL